jgi:hypothetical protein
MSKLSAIAAILTITLQLTACAQQRDLDPPPVVPAHIIGVLASPVPSKITLVYSSTLADFCGGVASRLTVKPDRQGRFRISIPIHEVTRWTLAFDGILVGDTYDALPGDSVHIIERTASQEKLGKRQSPLSGDAFNYGTFAREFPTYRGVDESLLYLESDRELPRYFAPAEFMALVDRRRDTLRALAPEWLVRHRVRQEAQEYVRSKIDYAWGLEHLKYIDDAIIWKKPSSLRTLPTELLDRVQDLANRPLTAYSAGPTAATFLERFLTLRYLRDLARQTPEGTGIDTTMNGRALLGLAQSLLTGESRDIAGATVIRTAVAAARRSVPEDPQLRMRPENNPDSLLHLFERFCARRRYYDAADTAVKRWHSVAPGAPAPTLTLNDTAGRSVSLTDLRGKPVFLFFWSTYDRHSP